eukprot:5072050-Pyramimonas_sp.AAC.1
MVTDVFVSLRCALAHALINQMCWMVYGVFLQRVQEPTNLQVRRLNAITRKLQACPKKIVYQAMTPIGKVDLHIDSGYRRLSGGADDDVKGYGIRRANLLRRGSTPSGKPVVHLIDAHCKSHLLQVRSSSSAETRAAAHIFEDCYPTTVTLDGLRAGPLTPI